MNQPAQRPTPSDAHLAACEADGPRVEQTLKPELQKPGTWPAIAVCLLLTLAVWAVFGQTRHFDFVNYDDAQYVCENPHVVQGINRQTIGWAFTRSYGAEWWPLTPISHMLDCQFFGLNPGGHHLTNVFLHTASAGLLFLLLWRMTGALWPAAFVAAVFALHPLRVESVAWVSGRKDVLSGLFFMLTLWAYARYAQSSATADRRSKIWYGIALLCFAGGLMSKATLVTVPFVLLLLDYWPLKRFERAAAEKPGHLRGLLFEKIPFLCLSLADGVVTLLAQRHAVEIAQQVSLLWRIGNALAAYGDYIWKMLWPVGLTVVYPHPQGWLSVWHVALALLILVAISSGAIAARRRHPYLLVGWLWYLGMFLPVIDTMQVGLNARADRYTYLPQIGLYVAIAWAAGALGRTRPIRIALGAVAVAALAGLLVAARAQTAHWRDSVSLWTRALACAPENALAHVNLGDALLKQGRLEEATHHAARALELAPHLHEAHNTWGVALAIQRRLDEAAQSYRRALELKPDYAEAHNNLANALAAQGQREQAIHHYQRALALQPEDARTCYNLGIALAAQGRGNEAIQYYRRALQLAPDFAEAHNNLAIVLAAEGRLKEARQHCELAVRFNPDYAEAHNNLAVALAGEGRRNEALQHLQRALHLATLQANPALAEAVRHRLESLQSASQPAPAR